MALDYSPIVTPSNTFTATTSGAVTAGQILVVSGNDTVAAASGTSAACVGVAAHDAGSGKIVTVHKIAGVIHETTIAAGATAGNLVIPAASGLVAEGTGANVIGVAMTTVGAGLKVKWLGR
jgi:hypothetical protein